MTSRHKKLILSFALVIPLLTFSAPSLATAALEVAVAANLEGLTRVTQTLVAPPYLTKA